MVKISPTVLVIVTFCSIFLVGFWVLLLPQLEELNRSQAILAQYQKEGVSKVTRVNLQQKDNQEKIKQVQEIASTLLPPSDNQYDLSVQLEGLSKNLGIPWQGLSLTGVDNTVSANSTPTTSLSKGSAAGVGPLDSKTAAASLKKVTIALNVTVNYNDLQRLLVGLVSINRMIQIDQLTVNSGGSDQLSVQISAFAYYLPPI